MFLLYHTVPIPNVTVTSDLTPYNGTFFNLTGAIWLDVNIVNTGIVATWTWSLVGKTLESEETVALPHQTVLRFQPLATNSSGLYSLSVTLRSLDNSDYIAENSGSTVYILTVLCK